MVGETMGKVLVMNIDDAISTVNKIQEKYLADISRSEEFIDKCISLIDSSNDIKTKHDASEALSELLKTIDIEYKEVVQELRTIQVLSLSIVDPKINVIADRYRQLLIKWNTHVESALD